MRSLVILILLTNCVHGDKVLVQINSTNIINVVDDKFTSVCLDQSILSPNSAFNFSSTKMQILLSGLSPSFIRFGGSPTNWMYFNANFQKLNLTELKKFVILKESFLANLLELAAKTKHRLLLDLNVEIRFATQWDPLNTIRLLDFIANSGYAHLVDFELGNEPVYMDLILPPKQLGQDFLSLKKLISQYPEFKESAIVGPDVVSPTSGMLYITDVIDSMEGSLRAVTFHHYYFRGDIATYKEYIDPQNFANLHDVINSVQSAVKASKYAKTPVWIGETSDSWHEGTYNVSDRFVSGFLWLEKLGLAASLGVKVIMRQTFFGFNYGLLDSNSDPNPDYWLTWLHNLLVGNNVIEVNSNAPKTFRVYSHCTKSSKYYPSGAVTVFALNINSTEHVEMIFKAPYSNQIKHLYLLEPDSDESLAIPILSQKVKLNGKNLHMSSSHSFPILEPKILSKGTNPILPPLTIAFIVFPQANTCS